MIDIIQMAVVLILSFIVLVYISSITYIREDINDGMKDKRMWFVIITVLGVIMVSLCYFVSPYAMPFAAISLIASFYSSYSIGITLISVFSIMACFVGGIPVSGFVYIYLPGLLLVTLFYKPSKPLYLVQRLLIFGMCCIMLYAGAVYLGGEEITPEFILFPIGGLAFNYLISLIVLRRYSKKYLETYDEVYERINDPEYHLLLTLKEQNKEEYYLAIHSAYLCDRMADIIGRDRAACKAAGYYHRIGAINGGVPRRDTVSVITSEKFPPFADEIITEYQNTKTSKPKHGETVMCQLANDVVGSIRHILNTKPGEKVDYDRVIEFIFRKKQEAGFFDECDLTIKDMQSIKEYLKGEKLYYDFLR